MSRKKGGIYVEYCAWSIIFFLSRKKGGIYVKWFLTQIVCERVVVSCGVCSGIGDVKVGDRNI